MEIQDKAKELFEKFYYAPDADGFHSANKYRARLQATLCCDEILDFFINVLKWDKENNGNVIYWQEVREAVESLPA